MGESHFLCLPRIVAVGMPRNCDSMIDYTAMSDPVTFASSEYSVPYNVAFVGHYACQETLTGIQFQLHPES
jgi:hypothetical protein